MKGMVSSFDGVVRARRGEAWLSCLVRWVRGFWFKGRASWVLGSECRVSISVLVSGNGGNGFGRKWQ